MDTLQTNAPPSAPRSPATLRRLSSVLRPLSSVFRRLPSVLRPLSSVFRRLPSVLRPLSSVLLPLALFTVLWLDLIRQLSYQWSTSEQYAYGWFVPFLALGLLLKKWPDRPEPSAPISAFQLFSVSAFKSPSSVISPPQSEGNGLESAPSAFSLQPSALPSVISDQPSAFSLQPSAFPSAPREMASTPISSGQLSAFQRFSVSAFVLTIALFLLPLRVIHEINQDWPLISWSMTTIVVGISLYAVYRVGGWNWVRHFAFPVCFILVAIQWPYRIENPLTKGLMRLDTNITVEILGWLNIPALQRGNVIDLATGTVGVDEACSGIRSFQSTLMAALFLGELYLLRRCTRLFLVVGGLALAFSFNVVRTLILAWQTNVGGLQALDKWHDPAGFTIAIACFGVLWLIAVIIKRKHDGLGQETESRKQKAESRNTEAAIEKQKTEGSSSGPLVQPSALPSAPPLSPREMASSPISPGQPSALPHGPNPQVSGFRFQASALTSVAPLPRFFVYGLTAWVAFVLIGNEAWYRSHELRQADTARWWVNYPTNLPSFRAVAVSKSAQKLLRHDVESGGAWEEPDGTKWSVYCFRWRAGDPTARMSALGHRPEYCLVGSGHNLIAAFGTRYLPANGLELPFRLYTFDSLERPLHVFFCLWEDGTETQPGLGKSKYLDRLSGVLAGRRGMGQQTLEIVCTGYLDMEAAEKAVRKRLPEIIHLDR